MLGLFLFACARVPPPSPPSPRTFSRPTPADCALPNPAWPAPPTRLVDRAEDGGFEQGVLKPRVQSVSVSALPAAARTGTLGLRMTATEGGTVELPLRLDKGTRVDLGLWLRGSSVEIAVVSEPPPRFEDDRPVAPPFVVTATSTGPSAEWSSVSLTFEPAASAALHWLRFSLPADAVVDADDLSAMATSVAPPTGERTVGGVPVPLRPLAPVLFSVLVHVEDIPAFRTDIAYLRRKAWLMEQLARRVAAHGGELVIQPGVAFVEGAETLAPGLLRSWTDTLHVRWSTHSHGPACRDASGGLQPPLPCLQHPDWARDITDADVIGYLAPQQAALTAATGQVPTDHNGNFDMPTPGALGSTGIHTLTAFKDPRTQSGFPSLYLNPWRPAGGRRGDDLGPLITHDPAGGVVYLPGIGVDETRWWDRLPEVWAPELAWRFAHADPARVNTAYVVLHVDAFAPREGSVRDWLAWDEAAGTFTPSAALVEDLDAFDAALGGTIDPLVAAGYLRWSTPEAMGRAFTAWEARCAASGSE